MNIVEKKKEELLQLCVALRLVDLDFNVRLDCNKHNISKKSEVTPLIKAGFKVVAHSVHKDFHTANIYYEGRIVGSLFTLNNDDIFNETKENWFKQFEEAE